MSAAQQLTFADTAEARRTTDDILWIVRNDQKNKPSTNAIIDAIRDSGIRRGHEFSANDLRPYLPSWLNTACIGAVLQGLAKRGVLAYRGEVVSTLRNTHGKRIGIWERVT